MVEFSVATLSRNVEGSTKSYALAIELARAMQQISGEPVEVVGGGLVLAYVDEEEMVEL